jgi:hypothetical protein
MGDDATTRREFMRFLYRGTIGSRMDDFNLGLIYERRDMLAEAEQEMLVSLRLEPE